MTMTEAVTRQAEQAGANLLEAVIERLAARVGGQADARAVYGTPVERDGVTVIPVARVRWAFGGGGGTGDKGESGSGGGGGVMAQPAGYIELKSGTSEFIPIKPQPSPAAVAPLLLAMGLTVMLLLRALRPYIKD
jgi:uncharacterized spore protein YtfJ